MASIKGSLNLRNSAYSAKSFLPPKSPFPSISSAYGDYGPSSCIPTKSIPRPKDGHGHHQRTSSETNLIEENPSWLDDLLNEPETPLKRGTHRRSSSDSFAYLDVSDAAFNRDSPVLQEYTNRRLASLPSWETNEFNHCENVSYASHCMDAYDFNRPQNREQERQGRGLVTALDAGIPPSKFLPHNCLVSSGYISEPDTGKSAGAEKQNQQDSAQSLEESSERREVSQIKHSHPETDQKWVKQQFAQRSRVRKLQYIAELERNVQALQAEGSEVSAELQFLDQQNLILSLENKSLKQRLDSLAQEQLLKHLQQEMLEREMARLRAVCQQQQQPASTHGRTGCQQQQQLTSTHGRSNSRDLDSRFAHLSLNHKQAGSGRGAVTGPLRI